MSIGLIISLGANVLLVIALFFRDALNKWLFHKIKLEEDEKKEERETLKRLRNLLYEFGFTFNIFALHGLIYFKGDAESIKFITPYFNKSEEKFNSINKELTELKPDLNSAIRDRLDNLIVEVSKIILTSAGAERFVEGLKTMNIEEFINAIVLARQHCSEFISDIEKKINR